MAKTKQTPPKRGRPPLDGTVKDARIFLRVASRQWIRYVKVSQREGYASVSAWARDQLDRAAND